MRVSRALATDGLARLVMNFISLAVSKGLGKRAEKRGTKRDEGRIQHLTGGRQSSDGRRWTRDEDRIQHSTGGG